MPAYIIKSEATIVRQEGDDSEVQFIIPAEFPLGGWGVTTFVKFWVYSRSQTLLFEKNTADFTRVLQTITCQLAGSDTRGAYGLYRWELQITESNIVTTIGKGNFDIRKEYSAP